MIGDDDVCGLGRLVDVDLFDLGRSQCLGDELTDVVAPLHDVHLLASQLVHHLTDPGPSRTHAGPLGVDVGIVGDDRDLGPMTGFPSDVDDLDGAVGQLRDLQLEEPPHQVGMAPGDHDLGALGLVPDFEDQCLHTIPPLQALEGDALRPGEDRLGVTQIQDHRAVVDLLHQPGDQVALAALVHLEYVLALGLSQLVLHHLLERLSGDAPESLALGGVLPLLDHVAVLVQLLGVDDHLAGVGVDGDPRLLGCTGAPFVGRHQGVGEGVEDGVDSHTPLPGEDLNGLHHRVELHCSPSVARLGGLLPPENRLGRDDLWVLDDDAITVSLDHERVVAGFGQDAAERLLLPLALQLDHDLASDRLGVVAGESEIALQARGAHLEPVRVVESGLVVEQTGQTARHLGEPVHIHVLAVDDHSE